MQSLAHAWNRFVCVLETCATFDASLQRAHAEAIRREQQKGRRSTSVCTDGIKTTAAFHTEQKRTSIYQVEEGSRHAQGHVLQLQSSGTLCEEQHK